MDAPEIPLFLDCDPGIDDALAIAYLLCQPDVNPVGLAATGGNVSTAQVARNALGWLDLAGRGDIPVHLGAAVPLAHPDEPGETAGDPEFAEETHGDTGTGYANLPQPTQPLSHITAAQAWVDAARAYPGELIGVLIGPATNLALALEIEPNLPHLVRRLFIMGGAFNYRGNTRPTTEWNVSYDPEAAAQVISAFGDAFVDGTSEHVPVIAPLEATEALEMTPGLMHQILEAPVDDPWRSVLQELNEALRFYFEFHQEDGHGYLAHIHDPYVVAAAIEWARESRTTDHTNPLSTGGFPWAETARAPVDVELTGTLTRGETVADWLGRWDRPANAEILRTIHAKSFLNHLRDVLMKGPQDDRNA